MSRLPELLLLIFATLAVFAPPLPAGDVYTQTPTIAPAQPHAEQSATDSVPRGDQFDGEPVPHWIWGDDVNKTYRLSRRFNAETRTAGLKASCDNRMTIFINGKRVASSDSWEQPITVDVQPFLRSGENEIVAEVSNAGGPAGFVCKLALVDREGQSSFVVSDDSWRAADKNQPDKHVAVTTHGKLGTQPWNNVFANAAGLVARDRGVFNVLPGFQVELLYTVPKDTLGSWVCIAFDDQGRLLASDQGDKGICRITPPAVGGNGKTKVEHLDIQLSSAQGMLHAFDSLYLSVNGGPGSGLYRARDTDGDDQYDEVVKLKDFRGGGEHGPHALRLAPDGQSIYVIAGNHTDPPADFDHSTVPANWGEDLLLPRQWDARGHARGKLAPGGWIARTDPDGKTWEIVSSGYRNAYDMDFNADGELFAYDADMEWDMGTPWYRPTRVVHAVSGSDFGWRSGTGKWPTYYVDSLPQLVDIGPGSPVGAAFGYGARFPAKYQHALYCCDWTFGTMYAVHLTAEGSSYKATKEEFLSRTPLPLTDNAIGPDGAMYFTVGGRGAQSELFRVTYHGDEATAPIDGSPTRFAEQRQGRRQLEKLHRPVGETGKTFIASPVLDGVWKQLASPDRHIRYAARVALEHQEVRHWQDRVATEKDPQTLISAAVALARQGDTGQQPRLLTALDGISFAKLDETQQLELLRAWALVFIRQGEPDQETAAALASKLDAHYPASSDALNRELCSMLVYLNSPTVVSKTLKLIELPSRPNTKQMSDLLARNTGYGGTIAAVLKNQVDLQKLHYAFTLRNVRYGWTLEQRKQYFNWLAKAREKSGGASYQGFIDNIRADALANASDAEQKALASSAALTPPQATELPKAEGPGHDWILDELVALTKDGLRGRSFEQGRKMFAAARCIVCHRFAGEGGATGPDLTNVAGRFSFRDLAEATVAPSKVISDQYRASVVVTTKGQIFSGRIVNDKDGDLTILVDPEDIQKVVEVPHDEVDEVTPSKVSLMPKDLLKELNETEVLDLLAYLQSRGNPQDLMFARE